MPEGAARETLGIELEFPIKAARRLRPFSRDHRRPGPGRNGSISRDFCPQQIVVNGRLPDGATPGNVALCPRPPQYVKRKFI